MDTIKDLEVAIMDIQKNSIAEVRELLAQNKVNKNVLLYFAIDTNHIEIIKLLTENEVSVGRKEIKHIFKLIDNQYLKELVTHIIQHNRIVNNKLIHVMFEELIICKKEGQTSLEILELLLDQGLDVNGFIDGKDFTPLHLAVKNNRTDFVTLLLERGAEINKKTSKGKSAFFFAIQYGNKSMVKLFLKKGAQVNEILFNGMTALHVACRFNLHSITIILLEFGADVNIVDNRGKTPLTCANRGNHSAAVAKEIIKLKFECQPICKENLEFWTFDENFIRSSFYDRCWSDLKKMKDLKVHDNFSLYDVLDRKNRKKLIMMTKEEDFVNKFQTYRNRYSFDSCYRLDVNEIFEKALKRRDLIEYEIEKISSLFSDLFPVSVIDKITFFATEDLYINYGRKSEAIREGDKCWVAF